MNQRVDVYLDESGDLGFGTGGSRFFVVAAMATTDTIGLRRLVRRANRRLDHTGKGAIEYKFNKSTEKIRMYFLRGVSCSDSLISWRAFDKSQESGKTALRQQWLYDFLCMNALCGVFPRIAAREVHVIADRRTSRGPVHEDLDSRIELALAKTHTGYFPPYLRISHVDSISNEALQVHDFVVGSIFQSLERGDARYIEIIASRIVDGAVIY